MYHDVDKSANCTIFIILKKTKFKTLQKINSRYHHQIKFYLNDILEQQRIKFKN